MINIPSIDTFTELKTHPFDIHLAIMCKHKESMFHIIKKICCEYICIYIHTTMCIEPHNMIVIKVLEKFMYVHTYIMRVVYIPR